MEEKTITPFTDLPYEAFEALSQYMNATGGTMSGFSVGKGGFRGGTQARQIAMFSESGNERVLVGTETDPLVLLGQLKDKTGTDEYGLWVKSGSAYIGGMRLFEAIVDPAGDGDYTTIAAAIAAGKKSIFLRKGVHILADNLTITADITIVGENREETIIQSGATDGASDYQIRVTGHYVQLRNFTKTNIGAGSAAIYVTGNRCAIENVSVTNYLYSGVKGIHIAGAYASVINCECIGDHAFYSTGANGTILNNIFTAHTSYGGATGTVLIDGNSTIFKDNYVWGAMSATAEGIITVSDDYSTITDNIIEGGGTSGMGIYLNGDHTVVSGNIIKNAAIGIRIQNGFNSVIADNVLMTLSTAGVQLGYSLETYNVTIDGNVITAIGADGIQTRDCYDCAIINNIIEQCGSVGIEQISGQLETSNISNNNIKNCTSHGIFTSATATCKYNNIVGNSVCYNGGSGLNVTASYSNIVSNITEGNTSADSITNTSGNTQYNIS